MDPVKPESCQAGSAAAGPSDAAVGVTGARIRQGTTSLVNHARRYHCVPSRVCDSTSQASLHEAARPPGRSGGVPPAPARNHLALAP